MCRAPPAATLPWVQTAIRSASVSPSSISPPRPCRWPAPRHGLTRRPQVARAPSAAHGRVLNAGYSGMREPAGSGADVSSNACPGPKPTRPTAHGRSASRERIEGRRHAGPPHRSTAVKSAGTGRCARALALGGPSGASVAPPAARSTACHRSDMASAHRLPYRGPQRERLARPGLARRASDSAQNRSPICTKTARSSLLIARSSPTFMSRSAVTCQRSPPP